MVVTRKLDRWSVLLRRSAVIRFTSGQGTNEGHGAPGRMAVTEERKEILATLHQKLQRRK